MSDDNKRLISVILLSSSINVSFIANYIPNFEKLKSICITEFDLISGSNIDYYFENIRVKIDVNRQITLNAEKISQLKLFELISSIYNTNEFALVFPYYKGRILLHNTSLFVIQKINSEQGIGTKYFYVITIEI